MPLFKQSYLLFWALLVLFCGPITEVNAQAAKTATDSTKTVKDSISIVKPKKKSAITTPINYKANDSIVLTGSGNAYLYGEGNVTYEQIDLTANYIQLDLDSSTVLAKGTIDKEGEEIGAPIFKDGEDEYKSKSIRYNMNTKKGYIIHGVVQQGEGYIIGEETKKVDKEIICMRNGKYTTCDEHEHPHFYLNLTKAKVKQKTWVVTGPAYLVMLDVPLPLAIPFGYFPFTQEYSSGIIVPTYGQELTRGFYISNGGYYFALNDYMDLAVTGDIYTKGTWALNTASSYVKKYKFRGNLNTSYREDVVGERDLPGFEKSKNLAVMWTHAQDPKASPNSTFSASVNFSSSGYDRSNINNYYNPAILAQNTKSSSISYGYRFPNSPFSISANVLANQRTSDSTIMLTLPDLTINMTRIYPFKRKNGVGKDRWFEKLSVSYNGRFSNSIETKEYLLLKSNLVKDWRNGFDHSIPVNMSFNVLKYISISPTVNYHERWYFQSVSQSFDNSTMKELKDTTNGFYRAYDFSAGISASTKLYGFFKPWSFLFGNKIDRIRHVFTPSVGFSYKPDFGDPFWKLFSSYQRNTSATDLTQMTVQYSPYASGMFGYPQAGESGSINFSMNNNLEMKVRHKSDTAEVEYRTVSLIDAFSVSSSYNMAADSMNWADFSANIRLKLFKGLNINLGGSFEPYLFVLAKDGEHGQRVNKLRWDAGKFPRLKGTGSSFGYTFNNETFKKKSSSEETTNANSKSGKKSTSPTDSIASNKKAAAKELDEEGYEKFKIPWSLSFDYSVQYGTTDKFDIEELEYERMLTHNMSMRGNVTLTSKWSISFGGAYDITNKKITYTNLGINRNLHCWNMSANIVPFGAYKTYNFLVQVSSSLLSDLKYEKRSDFYSDPINWY